MPYVMHNEEMSYLDVGPLSQANFSWSRSTDTCTNVVPERTVPISHPQKKWKKTIFFGVVCGCEDAWEGDVL
jgi:hypothetical protein